MVNETITFKLGELFCGPGGIALGAKNASVVSGDFEFKIEHVWATDYDLDTCKTYSKNICPDHTESVLCEDIRKLDLNKLCSISVIDGLAFGFPCNDYSIVGEQRGLNGSFDRFIVTVLKF